MGWCHLGTLPTIDYQYYDLSFQPKYTPLIAFVSCISVMPNFAEKVEIAVDALSYNPPREVDENEFIDASRLVYDGVRDIRQAVLLDRVSSLIVENWLQNGQGMEFCNFYQFEIECNICIDKNYMY